MAGESMLLRAVERYRTPFYLFDEGAIGLRAQSLRDRLPKRVQLCYAVKANPFVIEAAAKVSDRLEVCSPGELRICQALGVADDKLVISGVHKDEALMRELMRNHPKIGRYTVESPRQYEMLALAAKKEGVVVPILLRLSSGNQFGMDKDDLQKIAVRAHQDANVSLCGIQLFSGTQKTRAKVLARELTFVDGVIADLKRVHGVETIEFEYGPGLPVDYFGSEDEASALDESAIRGLADLLDSMSFRGRVILELGRGMVAACGSYVTSVVDTKSVGGENYAIVDGGKHQIVYFGNALGMKQPAITVLPSQVWAVGGSANEAWSVAGSLCTTTDILAKRVELPGLSVGDRLVFEKAGAYCMTEGLSLFLSRDLPRVILVDQMGALRCVRPAVETYSINMPVPGNLCYQEKGERQ